MTYPNGVKQVRHMKARLSQKLPFLSLAAAAVLAVAAGVCAAPGSTASKAPEEALITVMGPEMPLKTIFARMASAAGVTIDVAASITGAMDVSLSSVKLTTALDVVCRTAGLAWEKTGPGQRYVVRSSVTGPPQPQAARQPEPPSSQTPAPAASRPQPASEEDRSDTPERAPGADKAPATEKPQRQLTAAQLQLILQGVPQLKAMNLLEQWRHRTVASPRIYTPGGVPEPAGWRPSVVMTPYGPYYPAPPNVTYYMPDGSVWTGYPYPNAQVR